MKRQFLVAGMLAALATVAAVGLAAQSANPTHADTNKNFSAADEAFARRAAQGGLAEVMMGQLAEQNGSSEQVKDFGQRMVQDHIKANGLLTLDAAQEGIELAPEMSATDQAIYNSLSKLTGAAFDQTYARDMVSDHEKDISDFQKEAKDGRDPTIKKFAADTTPTLEEHLKLARTMQNEVTQTSSKRTKGTNRPS